MKVKAEPKKKSKPIVVVTKEPLPSIEQPPTVKTVASKAYEQFVKTFKPDVLGTQVADLRYAYNDALDLIEVWRTIRFDARMNAQRNRLLAALDALAKES